MRFDRRISIVLATLIALATPVRADDAGGYTKHILAAKAALKNNDLKAAEAELVEAQKLAPESKRKGVADLLEKVRKQAAAGAATQPAVAPVRADDAAEYAKRISSAQAALTAGRVDDASKEVDTAVKLAPSRFEAFVLRATILIKQKDFAGAQAALLEAQKLAPESKRQRIGETLEQVRQQAAAAPAALSGQDRLALAEIQQISDDAERAQTREARDALLAELLTKCGQYLAQNPRNKQVWALRAAIALQLERSWEAGEAAAMLVDLGVLDHAGDAALPTIARIDRNGWVKLYRDTRKQIDELTPRAQTGDTNAALRLAELYLNKKLYEPALNWNRKAADAGNSLGMNQVGAMYFNGWGVPQDFAQAMVWYRKAADAGNSFGMANTAALYEHGSGVPQSYELAMIWYRKAAEAGNSLAMNQLGAFYQRGWGVPADYAQAMIWYRKAADAGNSDGMNNVGAMYHHGWGVPQDYAQAMTWCRKAADAGNSHGMYYVGWMYQNGQGVPQDPAQARPWIEKAAQAGNENAKKWLAENPGN